MNVQVQSQAGVGNSRACNKVELGGTPMATTVWLWVSHSTFLCLRGALLHATQAQNPGLSTCFLKPIEPHLLGLPATTLQVECREAHDQAE